MPIKAKVKTGRRKDGRTIYKVFISPAKLQEEMIRLGDYPEVLLIIEPEDE
jgi:hypothetical protein